MPRFPIIAVLRADDAMTPEVLRAMARVERAGVQAGRRVKRSFRNVGFGKLARGARNLAGSLAGIAGVGGLGLAAFGDEALELSSTLTDVQVQAGLTDAEVEKLRTTIQETSKDTGRADTEIAKVAASLVDLQGKAGADPEMLRLLAKASVAASAPVEDLAGVVLALNTSFFDGKASAEEMEAALSSVIAAGKEGSVPLGKMARVLQKTSASFRQISQEGATGAADLAAVIQVARAGGFGSAEEAGTGLEATTGALLRSADKLKRLKIRVFEKRDGKKQLKPLRDILDQLAKRDLDDKQLLDAVGTKEAFKFLKAMTKGREEFERIAALATGSTAVGDDFLAKTESSSFRARKAMNDLRRSVTQAFTPERIETFASALTQVVGAADKFVTATQAIASTIDDVLEATLVKKAPTLAQVEDERILRQARGVATGDIDKKQRRAIETFEPEADVEARAAEQLRIQAQRAGFIDEAGRVDSRAAALRLFELTQKDTFKGPTLVEGARQAAEGAAGIEAAASGRAAAPINDDVTEPLIRSIGALTEAMLVRQQSDERLAAAIQRRAPALDVGAR